MIKSKPKPKRSMDWCKQWIQEPMTNDPHHINMRHDLERTRRMCGFSWQDVGQESPPNGLGFQSNQDHKSNTTSTSLQASGIRVSITHIFQSRPLDGSGDSQPSLQYMNPKLGFRSPDKAQITSMKPYNKIIKIRVLDPWGVPWWNLVEFMLQRSSH